MSEPYVKRLWGANTEVVSNPVNCGDADISSSHSGHLTFAKVTASSDVRLAVDHSATLILDELECKSLTVDVSYASTLRIGKLTCKGQVTVNVSYSSLFVVDGGNVDSTTGIVNYSSTGNFYAKIAKNDGVVAQNSSTWLT